MHSSTFPSNSSGIKEARNANIYSAPQHGSSHPASSQSVHLSTFLLTQVEPSTNTTTRPHLARIPRHSRPSLLHNLLRHRSKRRNRRPPPRPLPRHRARLLGFLGLLHRHRIARHPRHLLVRHSKHERREFRARHDRCHLALFPHPRERYSREPRHRYSDHDQFLHLLAWQCAFLGYAS